ncbi:MAG TPA: pyridoxamine 5'-phosphate oxidase family protein [Gammaproteobacteria bacterium]|nr:pyridoxamine 5'-phosphate oxidase family protein [Gammaproteobacteria bacterium]
MDGASKAFILQVLESREVLTLATVRPDGYPQATTVGYVNDGLDIYVGTFDQAQKVANIRRDPRVSLTVNTEIRDWSRIRGLSMGGRAEVVTGPEELDRVRGLMRAKFPQLEAFASDPAMEAQLVVLRIRPEVISVLDYTRGFGHTELVRA